MDQITYPFTRCKFGVAVRDATPPVGSSHASWGAAKHDLTEGIHKPLTATAAVIAPLDGGSRGLALVALDIGSALTFGDNYDDGIVNFLYNAQPGQYDRVLICYETPPRTVQADLVAALNAQPLVF